MKNKRILQFGFLLILICFMSSSSLFPLDIQNNFSNNIEEPLSSDVLTNDFLDSIVNFTLNRSDYEEIRDIDTFDITGDGRKEIIILSDIWNTTGDTTKRGLLQVFSYFPHQLDLLDSYISNESSNIEYFELNLYDIDEDGITEIIITGAITGSAWAFLKVFNFSSRTINFEWDSWWYYSFGFEGVTYNDMVFADFDDDGTNEVCTLTSIRSSWQYHHNRFRFWNVSNKELLLENEYNFAVNSLELFWSFDDNLRAYNIDGENKVEILIFGAYNSDAHDDSAKLWALNYNGTSLTTKAYTYFDYGNAGPMNHGLQIGDFDMDGGIEILTKFTWRDALGPNAQEPCYNMLNYSGNQFNYEFGRTYWDPGTGNHYNGDWLPKNFDLDVQYEFISTDFYASNNTAILRVWNYETDILVQSERIVISEDCSVGPPYIRFLDETSHLITAYSKQDGSYYKLFFTIYEEDTVKPKIIINSPSMDEFYEEDAPDFDVSVDELFLESMWYTLDNGITNITFTGFTGTFNQTEWDKQADVAVYIKFYANDTSGNINSSEITIYKDTTDPQISIISPTPNHLYEKVSPQFQLSIIEQRLNTSWYTLDNGVNNISFTGQYGVIDQAEWNKVENGSVTIKFYINDTEGRIAFTEVSILKDMYYPTFLYNQTWGETYNDMGASIGLDSLGNIYIAGYTGASASNRDMLLIKYDPDGIQLWNRTIKGSTMESAWALAIDSSDNVYITGERRDDLDGSYYGFIAKYNSQGTMQWSVPLITSGSFYCNDIDIDSNGNLFIIGTFYSLPFYAQACLIKFNENGIYQWNRTWGGNSIDEGESLVIDQSSGDIYISGSTYSFGGNIFMVKYNSAGEYQWNRTWGGINYDFGYGLTIDSSSNLYIVGYTNNFGYGNDIALIKYDKNGSLQWNRTWGGVYEDFGCGASVDSEGKIYIVGYTRDSIGYMDGIVSKFDEFGIQLWNYTWGGSSNEIFHDIVLDSQNNIYICGGTRSYGVNPDVTNDVLLIEFDYSLPEIDVISPYQHQYFGVDAPSFNISIIEANIDNISYNLNGGAPIPFSGSIGIIDQLEWEKFDNGSVIIDFFLTDVAGNDAFSSIHIFKDSLEPSTLISFTPYREPDIINPSTLFTLSADDDAGSGISIIRYKVDNIEWIDYSGPFNLSDYELGLHAISYYAIDSVGNIEITKIISVDLVALPSKSTPAIPGYEVFTLLGFISIIAVILLKLNRSKLNF